MPITKTNITFADEFNAGTTTSLTNCNVGDIITATINVDYSNILDASNDGSITIDAVNGSVASATYTGKQAFEIVVPSGSNGSNLTNGNYSLQSALTEYNNSVQITVSGYATGGLNTTFTVLGIAISSTGNTVIICSDSFVAAETGNSARIAITESITDAIFEYATDKRTSAGQIYPTIKLSNTLTRAEYKTTTSPLDATVTSSPVSIPFSYSWAYETGSLTIDGNGITSDVQSFILVHTFKIVPVSIREQNNDRQPDDAIGRYATLTGGGFAAYDNLYSASQFSGGYVNFLRFKNQPTGGWTSNSINNNRLDNQTMGVAVFDVNYLNTTNNYSIDSLALERTSDALAISVPLVAAKFTVSFDILNTTDTPFSDTNTKVKIGIENLPETILNAEDYEQTYLSDYAIATINATPTPITGSATGDAASITNYTATYNSTSSVTVSFDVDFTANGQTQIDVNTEPYFTIYAEVQDHLKTYANSDRIVLSVFEGVGIQDVLDETPVTEDKGLIEFIYDDIDYTYDLVECHPTNNLVSKNVFSIDYTNRPDLRINAIRSKFVLRETVTEEEIDLTSDVSINTSTFSLINSLYPQANYSTSRGYRIPAAEVRNLITLENRTDLDSGDIHYYEMHIPFKIEWQTWNALALNTVPSELIDTTEPNNGLNGYWYRLQTITNWKVFHVIEYDFEDGAYTFTQTTRERLYLYDYESNTNVVSRTLKSYIEDGSVQLINGSSEYILTTGKTLLKATWVLTDTIPTTGFSVEFFGERKSLGQDTNIERISSVNGLNSTWFEGIDDPLYVKKEVAGTTITASCYVLGDNITNVNDFTFYPVLYLHDFKLTEDGKVKLAEDGKVKILD